MNEDFTTGFFKDFDDSCSRVKHFFTAQLNKNDDLMESNDKLKLKVDSCNEKISVLEGEKKDLEKSLADKTAECAKLMETNERLNFNIVGFQVGNQAHGERIASLEKANKQLSLDLESRNKALEELQQKLDSKTHDIDDEIVTAAKIIV